MATGVSTARVCTARSGNISAFCMSTDRVPIAAYLAKALDPSLFPELKHKIQTDYFTEYKNCTEKLIGVGIAQSV
jgi:hypothetical protein